MATTRTRSVTRWWERWSPVALTVLVLLGGGDPARGQSPVTAVQSRAAPRETSVMIIYDSSGSMKEKVGRRRKDEVARGVFHDLIDRLGAQGLDQEVGLVAFGHQHQTTPTQKRCDDIELLVSPASVSDPGHRQRLRSQVDRLQSRGETPIAAAIRFAAQALDYRTRGATVVLISDGVEECRGDPCAEAAALKAEGLDFTAHVVGFDLTPQQLDVLRCVGEATGGKVVSAGDAAALADALERVFQEQIRGSLEFAVRLLGGQQPVDMPLPATARVRLASLDRPGAEQEVIADSAGPDTTVAPGRYRAELRWEGAVKVAEVAIGRRQAQTVTFTVAPSPVALTAVSARDGRPIPAELIGWRVSGPVPVVRGHENPLSGLALPPGAYEATADVTGVEHRQAFSVVPERPLDVRVPIPIGTLDVRASVIAAQLFRSVPVGGAAVAVYRQGPGDGWVLLDGVGAGSTSDVPAGRYRVVGRFGGMDKETLVALKGGQRADVVLEFKPGEIRAHGVNERTGQPLASAQAVWTVERLGPGGAVEGTEPVAGPAFSATLPPGTYRVTLSLYRSRRSQDIVVEAGEAKDVTIAVNEPL